MEVSCSIRQLYVGKVRIDGHSCMLLAFEEPDRVLVFLRDLDRFRGTMGAVGKFRCPLTI